MINLREWDVRHGIVATIELAGAHLETSLGTDRHAVNHVRERYLDGIEVCEGTAGDVDVVAVALLLLGLLIVVLEVVQRPG